jgi:LPXTG-motif cell wall-anchored protein
MPRSSRRLVTGAVLGLAVCAAGLVSAPAALAAPAPLPTPVVTPSTFVLGETTSFTVAFAGCLQDTGGELPGIFYVTNDLDGLPVSNGGQVPASGNVTFDDRVPLAVPGTYQLLATCDRYTQDQAYPPVTITVVRPGSAVAGPATATPTTTAPAPATATVSTTNGVTTITAAPGQSLTPGTPAAPGRQYQLNLTGYAPGEVTTWSLHSTPVALGTRTAGADGTLSAALTIPAGIEAGAHELRVTRADGTVVRYPITVGGPELAYTGTDVQVPLTAGLALLGAGAGLLVVTRRRKAVADQA